MELTYMYIMRYFEREREKCAPALSYQGNNQICIVVSLFKGHFMHSNLNGKGL